MTFCQVVNNKKIQTFPFLGAMTFTQTMNYNNIHGIEQKASIFPTLYDAMTISQTFNSSNIKLIEKKIILSHFLGAMTISQTLNNSAI